MENKKIITTEILEDVVSKTSADKIPIKDLIEALNVGGFGLIMMIFSLPVIIPLPPPFPSLIAVPMVVFAFQMMVGFSAPRLPKRFSNMTVKRTVLAMMVEKSAPHLKKAQKILKPRLLFLSRGPFERVVGFFCFIFASSVLMPLPLSNFIPGVGMLVTSFGLIGKDGVIILLGLLIGSVGLAITTVATLLGVEAVYMIKDFILHFFLK